MTPHRDEAQFPLHLCEVLEAELEALTAGKPPVKPPEKTPEKTPEEKERDPGPWGFACGHVRLATLPGLLARLRKPGDAVCAELRGHLSGDFLALLERQGEAGGAPEDELRAGLTEELNLLLDLEPLPTRLADACRKDRVVLSAEMELLLARPPADRRRLNRLLLEEALPGAFEGATDQRLAAVYQRIHQQPLAALCLSGGGIRSAVFSLGVVQGLAQRGLLHGFDYLSTVSGGGYFGGLLSAWIHRHPRSLDGVSDELAGKLPATRKLEPEPGSLGYLRSFSNYLSPRLGLLSADSWTLAAIFARNLYLHWLVFIPLLLALLCAPRLYAAILRVTPLLESPVALFWTEEKAALWPDGLFVLGSLLMTAAVAYIGWNRPSGGKLSTTRGFLRACLLPLTLSAVALTIYWAWYRRLDRPLPGWGWFVFPTILINLTGWSVHAIPALLRGRARPLEKLREVPFLFAAGAAGGGLTFLLATRVFSKPWNFETLPFYAVLAVPCVLGAFVAGETLFAGLASRWTNDEDREWWSRSAAWLLIVAGAWSAVAGIVIFGPKLLAHGSVVLTPLGGLAGVATALLARSSLTQAAAAKGKKDEKSLSTRLIDAGLAIAAPSFVVFLMAVLSLGVTALLAFQGLRDQAPPEMKRLPPLNSVDLSAWHLETLRWTSVSGVALVLLVTLAFGLLMALLIDVNKFSLHAMYRNRLIRTFLGASRENRSPSDFTGFDNADNLEIWRLRYPLFLRRQSFERGAARLCQRLKECLGPPSQEIVARHLSAETRRALDAYPSGTPPASLVELLVKDFNRMICGRFDDDLLRGLSASEEETRLLRGARSDDERFRRQRDLLLRAFPEEIDISTPPKPLHIVNVALNLVAGKKLAWQQRKAESFTFSPLHCGSPRLGYRTAESYGKGGSHRRAVSLGTAMAISGAAASPNMGYHSSPAITFLMTFFNARLGWWLGNPGVAGARTFHQAHPTFAVRPLISEALGLSDDSSPYVYLSDGGHFENLGLYEMVLRRCRHILVIDAGQDHECRFEDLGNAMRKIRIDLGIQIDLKKVPIYAEVSKDRPSRYCAVGTIRYQEVDGESAKDGHILYLKPAICGGEPRDILHYQAQNKTFPHESTGDQWFSESQFESYRMLGAHAVGTICAAAAAGEGIDDLAGLFRCASRYVEDEIEVVRKEATLVSVAPPAKEEHEPANAA